MQLFSLKEPNPPNLRALEVGSVVVTTKGFQWKLVSRAEEDETWEDFVGGLTWLPATEEGETWDHAKDCENEIQRLPTAKEYEIAERHGIREILEMDGRWWWSSSTVPYDHVKARVFNGYEGNFENHYRYPVSSKRYVSRPREKAI